MKTTLRPAALLVALLMLGGCSGMKVGSRMPYAVETAAKVARDQPAPEQDLLVDYHGADILRFLDNRHLLVGTLTFDVAGTPAYGPVILYDTDGMQAKWRIPREAHHAARHLFVAYAPRLVLRTDLEGRMTHSAYDPANGRRLWTHTAAGRGPAAYRLDPRSALTAIYVLAEGGLQALDAATGAIQWQAAWSADEAPDAGARLLALDEFLVLADGGKITALAYPDGRRLWTRANPVAGDVTLLAGAGGVFVYGSDRAIHLDWAGRMDWQWEIKGGGIKLVVPREKGVLVVTREADGEGDRLHYVAGGKTRWTTDLPGHVMSPVLDEGRVFYLTTGPRATESGARTLVGIDARRGRRLFQLDLPAASGKMETDYVPLADKLVRGSGHLFVLRESYGITAVDTARRAVAWTRPVPVSAKIENMNLIARVDPQFRLAAKDNYNPAYVAANLGAGQSALQNQLKYQHMSQALAPVTDTSPNLGGSAAATASAQQFQRDMNLAASTIVAVNALADASNTFWAAFGEALDQKANLGARMTAVTGIRMAEAQYQAAFSSSYCLPPPTETITLVDLENGKRADLQATLAIPGVPGRAWTAALSPDETRLAAVGIGVDSARYRPAARAMLEVPAASLVVYRTDRLAFGEAMKAPQTYAGQFSSDTTPGAPAAAPAAVPAGPSGAPVPAAPTVDTAYLVSAGYPPLVAYAMQGTVQDVQNALAAGEDVNQPYAAMGLTPLMAAVNRGHAAMVEVLLEAGADVHARSAFGKTVFDTVQKVPDPAARAEIQALLDAAAKGQ